MAHPRAGKAVDEALDLLRRSSGRGFFLFLHLFDPHWKYLPPEEFVGRFGPRPADIDRLLAIVLNREPPGKPTDVGQLKNLYDGEIAYLDREVGRFFEALEQMEIFDSSLIILTADHGEAFYEHGYWQHSDVLYEETIRVPLIVKWPGDAPKGRVGQPVSLIDIFPTLVEGAGLPHENTMGSSLAGFREGDDKAARRRTVSETVWSSPDNTLMKVVLRTDDLKYIATFAAGDDNVTIEKMIKEELYSLVSDPGELRSLDEADHLESFRRQLRSYLEEAGAHLARSRKGDAVVMDDEVAERLRSLGYIK
jgi:arylsulfatase A-like enzyme